MAQYRPPAKSSKYYLPKETFLTVVHYCRQYPTWREELRKSPDAIMGIDYQKDRVQVSPSSDHIERIAIRRVALDEKCRTLEGTAYLVAGELAGWLIKGVCYGHPYKYLQTKGIPCGKDLYYQIRRRFYYEMAKRI